MAFSMGRENEAGGMAVRVSIKGGSNAKRQGVLRLRKTTRFANRLAPLRMTKRESRAVVRILVIVFAAWSGLASATTYYVSSSAGSDGNNRSEEHTSELQSPCNLVC